MTNREKLLEELDRMPDAALFELLNGGEDIDCKLCPDCRAAGHVCPETDCDWVDEWMELPCRHGRLLEVGT